MAKISRQCAIYSLIALSLVFYGWHAPLNLLLILFSLTANYFFLSLIKRTREKKWLALGIALNVSILVYFKYTNFIIHNINSLFHLNAEMFNIILPLAISFYSFQQVAFLVDVYRKQADLPSFSDYCAFILFFPQLIAGPILRHSDFLPQLASTAPLKPNSANLSIGSTIFIIGLFKKTIFADSFATISNPIFELSQNGTIPSMPEAWLGMIAFSLQIYFDFSGYSDMAIGLARMFNFRFPINFNSPYKATSIIDFWRRWHISLSFLLRDYLYISFGGNRKGPIRRHFNLLATMLIGGLWHGASWTFVIWGGLHGFFLILNHLYRAQKGVANFNSAIPDPAKQILKRAGTFSLVTLTWIFFRAESFQSTKLFFLGLIGEAGKQPTALLTKGPLLISFTEVLIGLIVCFGMPNAYEWLIKYRPSLDNRNIIKNGSLFQRKPFLWRPTFLYLTLVLVMLFIAFGNIDHAKEFIYFQF